MNIDRIADVAAAIVGVALVAVLVGSPNTARVISAVGTTFASSLRAAMGR